MKKLLYIFVLLSLIIILSACEKASPTPFSSSPLDSTTFYSPSPTPAPTPTAEPAPTPRKGLGTVYGRLAGPDAEYRPWPGALFLAETVPTVEDPDVLIPVLDTETAPAATIDPYGHFYFTDVEPKIYGIVVWTPTDSYLVSDITRSTLYVTVKANESIDLGVVFTVLPP